jgi:hypothetical protein
MSRIYINPILSLMPSWLRGRRAELGVVAAMLPCDMAGRQFAHSLPIFARPLLTGDFRISFLLIFDVLR